MSICSPTNRNCFFNHEDLVPYPRESGFVHNTMETPVDERLLTNNARTSQPDLLLYPYKTWISFTWKKKQTSVSHNNQHVQKLMSFRLHGSICSNVYLNSFTLH